MQSGTQKFIELCEEYGRGRNNPDLWGTKAEDRTLQKCSKQFEKLYASSVDIEMLLCHESEFVSYLAAANCLNLDVNHENARATMLALRDNDKAPHMAVFAYLIADYLKLEKDAPAQKRGLLSRFFCGKDNHY